MDSTTGDLLSIVGFLAFLAGLGIGAGAALAWAQRAAAAERNAWAKERWDLCTRIQGWEPDRPSGAASSGSSSIPVTAEVLQAGSHPTEISEWDAAELANLEAEGIRADPGGGYWCTHARWLFDSVEDIRAWRSMLRSKGLPITLSPGLASDMGFEDAMQMARNHVAKQKAARIEEESGDPDLVEAQQEK